MNIVKTKIPEVLIIEPQIYADERGYFFESFNQQKYYEFGIQEPFVQDNQSFSIKGVIRGLHLQLPPFTQGKLARVISGEVLDVAVDCRPNSETFGQHVSVVLSEENKHQLWIPRGFAHGFSTLSNQAIFSYKCDNSYSRDHEVGILYNDPVLNIDWKTSKPIVTEKDLSNESFNTLKETFSQFLK